MARVARIGAREALGGSMLGEGVTGVRAPRVSPEQGEPSRRQLLALKCFAASVPALAVVVYETVRHDFLEHVLPTGYGNVLVGMLTLALGYVFVELLFRAIDYLQAQSVARGREVAALTAVVQERERLSRELHDGLAQAVSYILVRLDTVGDLVRAGRAREATKELEALRSIADGLYFDVRESIAGLRSRVAQRGLVPELRDYLDEFEDRHGIVATLTVHGQVAPGRSPLIDLQLFRIAQEALTNVRKHANASHVSIALTQLVPGVLEMAITDDGRGFDQRAAPGRSDAFGLAGMRERAESLGGSCRVESRPGAGTRIRVTVPTEEAA